VEWKKRLPSRNSRWTSSENLEAIDDLRLSKQLFTSFNHQLWSIDVVTNPVTEQDTGNCSDAPEFGQHTEEISSMRLHLDEMQNLTRGLIA